MTCVGVDDVGGTEIGDPTVPVGTWSNETYGTDDPAQQKIYILDGHDPPEYIIMYFIGLAYASPIFPQFATKPFQQQLNLGRNAKYISVDYRGDLSGSTPLPNGLDDAKEAYDYVRQQWPTLPVVLAGNSAGAHYALQLANDKGAPAIVHAAPTGWDTLGLEGGNWLTVRNSAEQILSKIRYIQFRKLKFLLA